MLRTMWAALHLGCLGRLGTLWSKRLSLCSAFNASLKGCWIGIELATHPDGEHSRYPTSACSKVEGRGKAALKKKKVRRNSRSIKS
jgi:hypothetical protein